MARQKNKNIQVLKSVKNLDTEIPYFPEQPQYEMFGERFQSSYPPAKTAEKRIITDFMDKHKRKPIGCTTT